MRISLYVPLGSAMLAVLAGLSQPLMARAADLVNIDAVRTIIEDSMRFKCGSQNIRFDEEEFGKALIGAADCAGARVEYWMPYYIVEVVPVSFRTLFLPAASSTLENGLGALQEKIMNILFESLNPEAYARGLRFSGQTGGSFGGLNYYETHVYRLAFDPMKAFKETLQRKLKNQGFSFSSSWLDPSICYFSEIDPFGWRYGVPSRECKWKRKEWCECWYDTGIFGGSSQECECNKPGADKKRLDTCEPVEARAEDRHRFWDGIRREADGFFSWAGLNDRSGRVVHADSRFAAAALALRASSLAARRPGFAGQETGGCWIEGKGADEFDPLSANALANDEVRIQLVQGSDGEGWDKCIQPGWEAKEWNRAEYWKGRVDQGAIFVIYKKADTCLIDGELIEAMAMKVAEFAASQLLTGGLATAVSGAKAIKDFADAVEEVINAVDEFVETLEKLHTFITETLPKMKGVIENIDKVFLALGSYAVGADPAAVEQMLANVPQTKWALEQDAKNLQVDLSDRLSSLRTDAVKATGARKQELEAQAKEMEQLKKQLEDRVKELAEQMGKQVVGTTVQLGLGALLGLVGVPPEVLYSIECGADSAWETYEGVMKLATFEACGIGIGDASKKAGNAIAKMEEFRRKGQKIAKHAKPLMEPACTPGLAHDGVRNVHDRVCSPAGPLCPESKSFHVKADKFLGYGKYADMACQVIDMVTNPPKDASGWLMSVLGTVAPNLGDIGGSMDALSALSDLPDPAPILSVASRLQNAPALALQERQKAVQDIQGLVSALKDLPLTSTAEAREKLERLAKGGFVKDWAKDIKNDVQDVFGSFPKPKFKWSDVKGVASQAQAMADEVKRLSELSKFNPTEPDKAVPILIGGIVTVAAIPVRIQNMATEAQTLAKKMSDYAAELSAYVRGPDLPNNIQKLADGLRGLDDKLIKDVEDALNPLDTKAVSDLAGRFHQLERDAAGWASLGVSEAASIQSLAGRTAGLLEKASKIQIVGTPLREALEPVSAKLDQAALYLGQLAKPDGLLEGIAGVLTMFAAGMNDLGGWAGSQNGCTEPDATNGCIGELFSKPGFQDGNGLPIGQIVAALGAIGKMQAGGVARTAWATAVAETAGKSSAETAGRFIRNAVPLRQEEIDEGKDEAWLEEKAKQEHEKQRTDLKALGPGGATPLPTTKSERLNHESPVYKLDQKAIAACRDKARAKGWDKSMCDRKW